MEAPRSSSSTWKTTEKFMDDDGLPSCEKVTCRDGVLGLALPRHDVVPPLDSGTVFSGLLATDTAPPAVAVEADAPSAGSCRTRLVPIDCQVIGNNSGCERTLYCPAGTKAVGAVAACDLEDASVTDAELATVPPNMIHVAKLSDHVPSGSCHVAGNTIIGRIVKQSPSDLLYPAQPPYVPENAVQSPIRGITGRTQVSVGCKEFDENGGDCQIRGRLYCR